ncbi:glycosyltransferase family 52 [Acinetobacter baumannii]|uniref:glycosyltransferase family 52 n=1 Tax=Acinetobacter baumannii TaxID=470 RepID=UPI0002AE8065|nr:glycosyltransferase family 52 [Acinetobacter baumannii]ELX04805.1 glycosyltransferase family 52 [Acinetobacter baumannii Naval-57]TPT16936.1 hypothetical protein FJU71_12145 [Acinetobacter baumannii]
MKKNLIVCLTPLQMLIAEKILQKSYGDFDLLCISYNKNNKYDYYFKKVSSESSVAYRFYICSKNKFSRFYDLIKFKLFMRNFFCEEYENVYVASIDNPFVHLALSMFTNFQLYTFDDGSANINVDSIYYQIPHKSNLQKVMMKLLGSVYDQERILAESKMHYTIYKDFSNIISNTTFLPLFSLDKINRGNKSINIFLGQPLHEIQGLNASIFLKFLISNGVLNYFPHPRETSKHSNFRYIETSLIFEDYIIELLEEGYNVNVYTISSTAALNVSSLEGVHIFIVKSSVLDVFYGEIYSLFNKEKNTFLNYS